MALLAASLVVRSAILALLLGGLTRARFLFALRFYLLVLPVAAISAATSYGSQAMLFYGSPRRVREHRPAGGTTAFEPDSPLGRE